METLQNWMCLEQPSIAYELDALTQLEENEVRVCGRLADQELAPWCVWCTCHVVYDWLHRSDQFDAELFLDGLLQIARQRCLLHQVEKYVREHLDITFVAEACPSHRFWRVLGSDVLHDGQWLRQAHLSVDEVRHVWEVEAQVVLHTCPLLG